MIKILGIGPNRILNILTTSISKVLGVTIGQGGSAGSLSLSDNFDTYGVGNLGGQGNWIAAKNNLSVVDVSGNKQITPSVSLDSFVRRSESFTGNHSSQITLKTIVNGNWMGVAVRVSGTGSSTLGYNYYAGSGDRYLEKSTPTLSTIAFSTSVTNSPEDTLRITIVGSEIRCYHNGTLDTALNGTGIFTDTDIASGGTPGLYGYGTAGTMDSWIGLDI